MKMMNSILFCFLYAILNASGAALIKSEIPLHYLNTIKEYIAFLCTWKVILGFIIIAASAIIIIKALSINQFSIIMPIAIGINFSLTIIIGMFFFKDTLSVYSILGLFLILSGIIIMGIRKG
jgi:multidrug transporter EmrE-like cation transporter